jgi:hypothetical protein
VIIVEPIEDVYFNWLCAKVVDRSSQNYDELLRIFHRTEFIWVVPADRHRADDGVELKQDFIRETRIEPDIGWSEQPCSILELFISFAKRAQFQTDVPVKTWFWEFLTNLKLEEFARVFISDIPIIDDILYTFIWRQYDASGYGGMFPISRTDNDQRKIEIWYQFCEYLDDRGIL